MLRKHVVYVFTVCLLWPAVQGWGQQPPAGPKPKDTEEYNLINSAFKETDPTKKLALLDQWKQKYPETEYKLQRLQTYMQVYQQLNQAAKAVEAAKEALAIDPNDLTSNLTIASLVPFMSSTDPQVWPAGEKAAQTLLKTEKPANIPDAQWPNIQKTAQFIAHQTLGWVGKQQKKNEVAEQEFIKALEINPQAAQVSYWLGEAVLAQKNPDKNTLALFSFARAAAYDGQGGLTPAGRQQIEAYLAKVYKGYHGDDPQGLAELKRLAKASPLPPPDLKIKSAEEVAAEKEEELRKSNPLLAQFLTIKENLTGTDSANFWGQMKGTAMIKLRGTVVSAKPAVRPKVVELAMSQAKTPEITLTAPETPARCQLEPGAQIEFDGSEPVEFTREPFMIKMNGGKITSGCKEAPAPAKKAGTKKSSSKATKK